MTQRRNISFIEKTLEGLAGAFDQTAVGEQISQLPGLLQALNPRIKVVGMLLLIIASAASHVLWVVLALLAVGIGLALASQVSLALLARRVWIGALIFTGAVALPALFLTPGAPIAQLPVLGWPITGQGLNSAGFLISRVLTSATLAITLVLTTPWAHVLKALRVLRVPVVFVVILGMTYRYIFLLLQTARDMFESRRSRTVGRLDAAEQRRLATASIGVLMTKSFQLSSDVYLAMQSRGFRGEVYVLDEFSLHARDWIALALFVLVAAAGFWLGR